MSRPESGAGDAPLRSCLVTGRLVHRRFRPREHRFSYPVYLYLFDLDELERLERRLPLFALNRFHPVSLDARDHLGGARGSSPRANVEAFLRRHGVDPTGTRIELLTHPRLFGFAFNPVSFYFVSDRNGARRAVVAEVRNTFGERHRYLLDERTQVAADTYETEKRIFVSPFAPGAGRWRFHFAHARRGLSVHMDAWEEGESRYLDATLAGVYRPLTTRAMLLAMLRYPAVTLGVVAAIHWQALRLWLKRIPHFRHVPQPAEETP